MAERFIYARIVEAYIQEIREGKLKPGAKLPAAKLIARKFHTSEITVNKALNILASKEYIRRSTGSGSIVLKRHGTSDGTKVKTSSRLIGVIIFDVSHPFWAKTLRGIEEVCRSYSSNLLMGNDEGVLNKAESYIKNFISRGVKGIIFVPIGFETKSIYEGENRRLLRILEESSIPYVLLHRRIETYNTSVAQHENYLASRDATRLLLSQGVKNPLCISQYYSIVTMERERGFIDALTDFGFTDAKERVFHLHPLGQTVTLREMDETKKIFTGSMQYDGILTISADLLNLFLLADESIQHEDCEKIISFDYDAAMFSNRKVIAMLETSSIEMGRKAAEILFHKVLKDRTDDMYITLCPTFHIKEHIRDSLDSKGYLVPEKVIIHG